MDTIKGISGIIGRPEPQVRAQSETAALAAGQTVPDSVEIQKDRPKLELPYTFPKQKANGAEVKSDAPKVPVPVKIVPLEYTLPTPLSARFELKNDSVPASHVVDVEA